MAAHHKYQQKALEEKATSPVRADPAFPGQTALSEPSVPRLLQRAVTAPGKVTPADLRKLQRIYGNRAIAPLVQPKSAERARVRPQIGAQLVQREPIGPARTPTSRSPAKATRQGSTSTARSGAQAKSQGSPIKTAKKDPPGGIRFIWSKGGAGSFGYTERKNAAAYACPELKTTNTHVRKGFRVEHYAEVLPTKTAYPNLGSYYPGKGYHRGPGGIPYHWYVKKGMQDFGQKAEQEHLDDQWRAYELTYKLVADQINSMAGKRYGPAKNPTAAEGLAEKALENKLPKQLRPASPAHWVKLLDKLLPMTSVRDHKGWHHVTTDGPTKSVRTRKGVIKYRPTVKGSKAKLVPSSQVIKYP